MKAKEALEKCRHLSETIEWQLHDLEFFERYQALDHGQMAINFEEEIEDSYKAVEELFNLRRQLRAQIARLPREDHKNILQMRYFGNHTWNYIARRLFYSYRYVQDLHTKALNALDKIMEEDRNNAKKT